MVSTPTRTPAAAPAATKAARREATGSKAPAPAAANRPASGRPESPGLVPGLLVRPGRNREVPQRLHVLPDPGLHPRADGDRHHDGALRLQRRGHRGGGVALHGRPQAGDVRRDRPVRHVPALAGQRGLAQARRLDRHHRGVRAAGAGAARRPQRPRQPELDRRRTLHLPALRGGQTGACPVDGHGAGPQGQAAVPGQARPDPRGAPGRRRSDRAHPDGQRPRHRHDRHDDHGGRPVLRRGAAVPVRHRRRSSSPRAPPSWPSRAPTGCAASCPGPGRPAPTAPT